jgi:hypothetical protein
MKFSLNQAFTHRSTGLSRKKTTADTGKARAVYSSEVPPGPAEPGIWNSRIEPFLKKHALVLAACFVLLGAGRIVSTYHVFSTTGD